MGLGSFFDKFVPPAVGKVIGKFIPFLSPILSTMSIVSMALTWLRKPDEPEFNFDTTAENIAKGVLLNKTAANGQIPVIYGTRKVGGTLAFLETSGTDNQLSLIHI